MVICRSQGVKKGHFTEVAKNDIIEFIERLFSFTGEFLWLSEPSSATRF